MTDSVTPGNRAPRQFKGRRPNLGSVGLRAVSILETLDTLGPTRWKDLRSDIVGGDRGVLRSVRACLFAAGLMYDTGQVVRQSPVYDVPDNLYDLDWRILQHLDDSPPVILNSATHEGMFQVRCAVCRLTKPVHNSPEAALAWFWGTHMREAEVHGLASA